MHQALSRWAAITVPVGILTLGVLAISHVEDARDRRALRNAGHVVNGRVVDQGIVAFVQEKMAMRPLVLVVGPSVAHTHVAPQRLANALGIPPHRVAVLSLPNSTAAHWAALLKNHVFSAGAKPALIVVASPLQSMLEVQPHSPASEETLEALLLDVDPIRERVSGAAHRTVARRVLTQRAAVRRDLLNWVRGGAVAVAFGERWRAGLARANQASARVFEEAQLDPSLHRTVSPVSAAPDRGVVPAAVLPSPDASMLPDLLDLAAEHGSKIAIIRTPLSPLIPEHVRDVVRPGTPEAVARLAERPESLFLDLSAMEFGPDPYRDAVHLSREGAQRFSATLGSLLHPYQPLAPSSAFAKPPALRDVRRAIDAATAHVEVHDPWPDTAGRFRIRVAARGEGLEVRLNDAALTLSAHDARGVRSATYGGPPPDPPWTLTASAAGLELLAVALGDDPVATWLVGDAEGWRPSLLGPEGAWEAAPPPPLRLDPPEPRPGGLWSWRVARIAPATARVGAAADCVPYVVTADGELLPPRTCDALIHTGKPGACFDGESLYARPAAPAAQLDVAWDPSRRCAEARWLYPDETLRLWGAMPPEGAQRVLLRADPTQGLDLEIEVWDPSDPSAGALASQRWQPQGMHGVALVPFHPVGPDQPLELRVRNHSGRAVVLTEASWR